MWWLVTLLVLALIAFFVVKSMKAGTQNRQAEHDKLQNERLAASSSLQDTTSENIVESSNESANVAQQAGSVAAVAATAGVAVQAAATAMQPTESGNSVHSGDTLSDVREMIKILNLDGPDAARLEISRDELSALRKGEAAGVPDASALDNLASKLRQMLA